MVGLELLYENEQETTTTTTTTTTRQCDLQQGICVTYANSATIGIFFIISEFYKACSYDLSHTMELYDVRRHDKLMLQGIRNSSRDDSYFILWFLQISEIVALKH
uniref:Uncharacterized protein n=1 Tax=Glossina pallidipes TaxID=7398 RepID=A0A1A9ZDD8_GLOPL